MLEWVRLIFGIIVLVTYLAATAYVIRKSGLKRFDGKVYLTIFGFLLGMGLNVGLCFAQVILGMELDTWKIVHFPQKVEDFVIVTIFYSFIYEMRVVWLKMTSDDLKTYNLRKQRQRKMWTAIYLTIGITLGLEILMMTWIGDKNEIYQPWKLGFIINLLSRILSNLTDLPIIVMLWMYFGYFFQRKKEAYTKKYRVFSKKQKAIVIWVLIILILNSMIFLVSNVVEVLIVFPNLFPQSFKNLWSNFMYFIYDFLILNDGILILWMYKGFSKVNAKKGQKGKPNEAKYLKSQKREANKRPSDLSSEGGLTQPNARFHHNSVLRLNMILKQGNTEGKSYGGPKSLEATETLSSSSANQMSSINYVYDSDEVRCV